MKEGLGGREAQEGGDTCIHIARWHSGKEPASKQETQETGLIPVSGGSSGVGNGNQLHYSCLENPMDRKVRWATQLQSTGSQRGGHD